MFDSAIPRSTAHHAPCPSLSPGVCSNLSPLSQWCHPTIYPLLPLRWPKNWSFRFSSSPSMNIQSWFPLGWTGLISLLSKGLSRVFSSTMVWKHQFFSAQPCLWSNSHICTWLLKNHSFDYMGFVCKVMSLFFNILSRFVIVFLLKSKLFHGYSHYLQWLWNPRKERKALSVLLLFTHLFVMKW